MPGFLPRPLGRRQVLTGLGVASAWGAWPGWVALGAAAPATGHAHSGGDLANPATMPTVRPGTRLRFPVDHGAHPDFRTEWWYATGAVRTAGEAGWLGFQVTFFRSRVSGRGRAQGGADGVGRFDPQHLLFAHAALTDVAAQRQWHAQRLGRWNGDPGVRPDAATLTDTGVRLGAGAGAWSLVRQGGAAPGESAYRAQVVEPDMAFDLMLTTTQPVLLQGDGGFSRKGPDLAQASHYYSQPQLAVTGTVRRAGGSQTVTGTAWLDHEWSETLLHPDAVGWDWVGMNLDNGAALTAFQLRRADGSVLWAGGSWRASARAPVQAWAPQALRFTPGQRWVSPLSQASYPLHWRLDTPVGSFGVRALAPAQELDSRQSTGTVYWEGLSELVEAGTGKRVGLGYLEMTGYVGKLRL